MPVAALQVFREGDILDLVPLPVPALTAQLHNNLLSLQKCPWVHQFVFIKSLDVENVGINTLEKPLGKETEDL